MTLSDRSNVIKIGQTEKHPEVRAEELTKQESSPCRFSPIFYIKVSDVIAAERIAHTMFNDIRIDSSKEFFTIENSNILRKIQIDLILKLTEVFNLKENDEKNSIFWEKTTFGYKKAIDNALLINSKITKLAKIKESSNKLLDKYK